MGYSFFAYMFHIDYTVVFYIYGNSLHDIYVYMSFKHITKNILTEYFIDFINGFCCFQNPT